MQLTREHPLALSRGTVVLGSEVVLHEVDFHVEAAEFVVLLGANGSGKTTLIRAILGLVPISSGSVALFGSPPSRFHDWHRIGYVPQRFTATAGVPATVQEVVLSGRVARSGWRPYRGEDLVAVANAIEALGMTGMEKRSVAALSGGQQQRVLIARALAGDPDVLVLDEPVSGVDIEHQQAFADALRVLKSHGRSVLLVAHALGLLESLVDRAVVLDGGHVTYDGPPLPEQVYTAHVHHHPGEAAGRSRGEP